MVAKVLSLTFLSFTLVPAAPVLSEVRVRYDQSTGGVMNIMATWNRMVSLTFSVSTSLCCNNNWLIFFFRLPLLLLWTAVIL